MAKSIKTIAVADEVIMNKIYLVRGQKVMIDRDLAELYGVETKRLKEAVRRNITRFPPDLLFEMNKEEFENWRTQNATSKEDKHPRIIPGLIGKKPVYCPYGIRGIDGAIVLWIGGEKNG